MQFRAVVFAAMLVAPELAAAQMPLPSLEPAPPLNGLYIGAGAEINWLQNRRLINAAGTAGNAALQSRYGWAGVGSLGYALPNGLRVEVEGDYRNNQFAHGRDFGFPAGAGGREINVRPDVQRAVQHDRSVGANHRPDRTLLCAICRRWRRLSVGASKWVSYFRRRWVPQYRLQ